MISDESAQSVSKVDVKLQSQYNHFESETVTVTLEWTYSNQLAFFQNLSVHTFPAMAITFIGNMSIQLAVPYNVLTNVSFIPSPCGNPSESTYIELYYGEFQQNS